VRAQQLVDALLEWGGPGGLATSEWSGFWMDSSGKFYPVSDHVGWARRYVLKDLSPTLRDDTAREAARSGVYAEMSKRGWLKITVEFGRIMVDPTRALRNQMATLQEYAIENQMKIYDSLTGRKIYDPADDQAEQELDQ
jgi:hypothetical protein